MSRDIRSFFLSSKTGTSKKNDAEDKKKSKTNEKGKSKKRAIVSSDEDEVEATNRFKNKKAKTTENKDSEKLVEIVDPQSVFSKKSITRVNATKVNKKSNLDSSKEVSSKKSNSKIDFEDDDFEATLNQLDTSEIEDKYLAVANNEKSSPFFNANKKTNESEKNGSTETLDIKKEFKKDVKSSPEKIKVSSPKDKISLNHKNKTLEKKSNLKQKKNTDLSKPQIEIEKVTKSEKNDKKLEETNYNDIIEEKIEKKKQNAMLYQSYLNRGGARNPGSKEVPKGADQCFANMTFLITGVLDSLEREEADEIIKKYGGKIVHSVSKKLNYIIIGDEPGPSKLAKAESLDIKKISEDGFLDLLRMLPPGPKVKKSVNDETKRKREELSTCNDDEHTKIKKKQDENNSSSLDNKEIDNHEKIDKKSPIKVKSTDDKPIINSNELESDKKDIKINEPPTTSNNLANDGIDHITALVEKYRPKTMKQIIGQAGDKSNAKKLQNWLENWHKNHCKDSKITKPKFQYKDETGAIYKAALLSGPPGIGKTTTAYVVCAQLGFEVLEFNASDTRSKKLLQEQIASILKNKTVKSFINNDQEKQKSKSSHVLLMDEVDGMAGNEDRGGMQELISFIKATEIPIICICNDRNSPKIKTLSNYTFDLRFQKPRLEQIRAAMMSICFKENVKISQEDLTRIIQSTNQDIRQVINHIAILSSKSESKTDNKIDKFKNLRLGPWEVIRKVFSAEEHKSMNIHDKSDLFFHDYNIAPLFVEENYLIVTPSGPKKELYDKLAKCSESLAIGDIIENCIRGNSAWSLLPVQACFSSVIPGSVMSGFMNSQVNFPSWLGKNSRRNKCDRLLQDITVHCRVATGASKEAINLDYLKMLVDSIVRPLAIEGVDGVDKALEVMSKYHLTREDLDSLLELTKWPHTRDLMQSVDTKTKTAFTKAYNKTATFNVGSTKKKSTRDTQDDELITSDVEQISDNEDDNNIENDKLIKSKTSKASTKTTTETKSKAKKPPKNQLKKKK